MKSSSVLLSSVVKNKVEDSVFESVVTSVVCISVDSASFVECSIVVMASDDVEISVVIVSVKIIRAKN